MMMMKTLRSITVRSPIESRFTAFQKLLSSVSSSDVTEQPISETDSGDNKSESKEEIKPVAVPVHSYLWRIQNAIDHPVVYKTDFDSDNKTETECKEAETAIATATERATKTATERAPVDGYLWRVHQQLSDHPVIFDWDFQDTPPDKAPLTIEEVEEFCRRLRLYASTFTGSVGAFYAAQSLIRLAGMRTGLLLKTPNRQQWGYLLPGVKSIREVAVVIVNDELTITTGKLRPIYAKMPPGNYRAAKRIATFDPKSAVLILEITDYSLKEEEPDITFQMSEK